MRNWSIAVGIFVAAFAVTAAYRKKRSELSMSFYELYKDNDVV